MSTRAAARCLLLLLWACGGAQPAALLDLDGVPQQPTVVARGAVHVLVFTSHECPIANSYAPTLQQLAAAWQQGPTPDGSLQDRAVRLFLVHVDPDLPPAEARAHAAAYGLPGTILLDPTHVLARALGATRTPEAVVLTGDGIAYRGRIDDQWQALGSRAQAQGTHDLADAVREARAGRTVPPPHPAAVGCLLPEPRRP